MSLKIICGSLGTGKSAFVINEIKELAESGKKALYIVPEQFSHVAETDIIKAVGYLSADLQATSFERFAKRALTEAGQRMSTIDAAGKNMLLARVLLKNSKELKVFGTAWEKPGFSAAFLDLISDFKRAQINSETLGEYVKEEKNPLLAQKLTEILKIYDSYTELLNEKFTDAEDNIKKLSGLIYEQKLTQDTKVYIDSFFRFTANELDVVRSMLLCGTDVTLTVSAPGLEVSPGSIFEPCVHTAETFIKIAKECGAEILPVVYLDKKYRFSQSEELLHLETELYSYPNKKYSKKTKDISLFIAKDPYTEAVETAVAIKKAVAQDGIRYRDIAIIAGDMDRYQSIIKTVFPSYEIPVFTDTRRELLSHPVMLMLFSVFKMLTGGFKSQDVIAYAKSGYSGLTADEADRLENYAMDGHIERGDWLDDERFLKRAKTVFDEQKELLPEENEEALNMLNIKNRLFEPVLALKEAYSADRKIVARMEALYNFFEKIDLRGTISKQTEDFINRGLLQLADEYRDIYNLLMETLDQVVLCMGEESMGLRRLMTVLESGFSEYSMGIIPSANDQVFLGDINRSIVKNVKLLFAIGASDGAFPPVPSECGILTDSERVSLRLGCLMVAPDTQKIAFDNRFLVYSAVNISTNAVRVSYPVADFEGKAIRPSAFVLRLKKIFADLTMGTDLLDESPSPEKTIASRQSAYRYLLGSFVNREKNELTTELINAVCEVDEYAQKLKRAQEYSHFKNEAQKLSRENVSALYGKNIRGSISRFEKFSACPFAYFIQYGLKAKERKVLELDTPDIGSLLHGIIDEFSKYMQKSGESYKDISKERCEEIVEAIINEKTGNMFISNLYSQKKLALLIKRLKQMVMKSVWVICEHIRRGEFEPCAFEASFDENGEMPPITIKLPTGEEIVLTGRIDRIDKYKSEGNLYIRIIDYKSGEKEFRLSDVFNKLSLQLAVYLTAACDGSKQFLGEKAMPAGMFYFRLLDPVLEVTEISDEKLSEEIIKKYKMSGLVLSDIDIIKAMDKGVSGYSKIIPVRISSTGEILEKSSKSATLEQIERLKSYMKKTLRQIGEEILDGNVDISPYHDLKGSACTYCKYKSVCGFDSSDNHYRYVPPVSDEEVWGRI